MTVNDSTIATVLSKTFDNLGKVLRKLVKKLATKLMKNLGRALESGVKAGSPAVSRNPTAALPTSPDVRKFHHTGKGLHTGKIV